jgi:transcriptional regulator with XRE-family HTH domain
LEINNFEMTGTLSNLPLQIGRMIKERIKELNLEVTDVCENTGISKSTLYNIYHGKGGSIEDLCTLLLYLEMALMINRSEIQSKPEPIE